MNYQLYKQKIIDEYIIKHQEYINSTLDFYEFCLNYVGYKEVIFKYDVETFLEKK